MKRQRRRRVAESSSPSPGENEKKEEAKPTKKVKKERSASPEQPKSPRKTKSKTTNPESDVEKMTKKASEIAIKKEEPVGEEDDILEESSSEAELSESAKEKKVLKIAKTQSAMHTSADWKAGTPVPYAALCQTFSKIEMTTKRLEILSYCSLFLRQVLRLTPEDTLPTVQLMVNKLAADYSGIELGIGESLLMKAIGGSTGRSLPVIKADHRELGDLGLVAAKSRLNQPTMFKPKPLSVRGVHQDLLAIATTEGSGAQGRKVSAIMKLLSASDAELVAKGGKGIDITVDKGGPCESKYIVRALEGKMRLGLADKTVLVALAQAFVFHDHDPTGTKGTTPSALKLTEGENMVKSVYR